MPSDHRAVLLASDLFDEAWYGGRYPDVAELGISPVDHFLRIGARMMRDPGPKFSTRDYLRCHADVRLAGVNPLLHYLKSGRREKRETRPSSDEPFADAEADLRAIADTLLKGTPARVFKKHDEAAEVRFVDAADLCYFARPAEIDALRVSVVMPTYNRADRLRRAIESVVEQTHVTWELIVVDDGSTDATAQVLESFASDTRIRPIRGAHLGVSGARNAGLASATGEYVFYLDSDNRWTPTFLRRMLTFLAATGAACGYSAIALEDDDGKLLAFRGEPFDWQCALTGNYVDLNAFGHHRRLHDEHGGFDERLRRMVDWDLILRYTRNERPVFAPFIGCLYRESRTDTDRITMSEPMTYLKVVQTKNRLGTDDLTKVASALRLNIAIKIPAHESEREQWGDYHFADSLREAFERLGHSVTIDFYGRWYTRAPSQEDLVIVLRGLTAYTPRPGSFTILWNISHPDQVDYDEYDAYSIVYVASSSYPALLQHILDRPARPLLQCTDPMRFPYLGTQLERSERFLFVGNSRNQYREIVRIAVQQQLPLEVHGTLWAQFIDPSFVQSENLPNRELALHYAGAHAVLNDHWESMRLFGFVSNRVFDVLGCGGRLVSDAVPSIGTLFGDAVAQYDPEHPDAVRLDELSRRLPDRAALREVAERVHREHSFDARARTLLDAVRERLGLQLSEGVPATSSEARIGVPTVPTASAARRGVALFGLRSQARLSTSTFVRLLSPLSGEAAHAGLDVKAMADFDDARAASLETWVVQSTSVQTSVDAQALVQHRLRGGRVVLDHADFAEFQIGAERPATAPPLADLMEMADEVWFSTPAQARRWADTCRSQRVLPNSLDERIWRSFRPAPQQEPSGGPLRLLHAAFGLVAGPSAAAIRALARLAERNPDRFTLTVVGAGVPMPDYDWLRCVQPPGKAGHYPRLARWLREQPPFDLGIGCSAVETNLPCHPDPLTSAARDAIDASGSSDIVLLHHAAIGVPTLLARQTEALDAAQQAFAHEIDDRADDWLEALDSHLVAKQSLREKGRSAGCWLGSERGLATAGHRRTDILRTLIPRRSIDTPD